MAGCGRWHRGALSVAVMAALASPAHALFGDEEARGAIAELRAQVQALQERLNQLALESLNRETQGKQDLARLHGQIEELTFKLQELEKRQRDLYLDLDARLRAISAPVAGASAGMAAAVPASPASAGGGTTAAAAPSAAAEARFDQALKALQEQRAAEALTGFEAYLNEAPNAARVVEARFWAGTAALQVKQYEKARQHFARVVFDHPKHELVPDAMLGLANALQGLKDNTGANDMLKRLAERYPDTPAGRIAKQRLGR